MVQVMLPDQTVTRLEQSAARRGLDTTQLLVQLVEEYLADQPVSSESLSNNDWLDKDQKIEQEQICFEKQHAQLLSLYQDQYIAMHEGKVVDHDADRIALRRRIRARFAKIPVLITPVNEEPRQTIFIRSPKLVEDEG